MNIKDLFGGAKSKGRRLAEAAPDGARQAAQETRRTALAVGEVLDERTGGRVGQAVARGEEIVDRVSRTPGQAADAFRAEAGAAQDRPSSYRPEPIEPPSPIERPEPL